VIANVLLGEAVAIVITKDKGMNGEGEMRIMWIGCSAVVLLILGAMGISIWSNGRFRPIGEDSRRAPIKLPAISRAGVEIARRRDGLCEPHHTL